MGTIQRNTTTRDRHRRYIARTKPPCGICNQPIDYDLPYLDPMSYVVDHVVPLARGGADGLPNLQAAHRRHATATNPRRTSCPTTSSPTRRGHS